MWQTMKNKYRQGLLLQYNKASNKLNFKEEYTLIVESGKTIDKVKAESIKAYKS